MTGFLLLNKPKGVSSSFCVSRIRRIVGKKSKVGHAGTLDPFATGLLIIAIGREATKMLPYCMGLQKTYLAKAHCGELTDTLDCTGIVLKRSDCVVTRQNICTALESFGSSYVQIPPLYSACKYQGMPLYKLARQRTIPVEELTTITQQKQKIVHLYELKLISCEFPFFSVCATVSQGTYIRTLMNDIAVKMGTYATTYELERSAIGPFSLADAHQLEDFVTLEDVENNLISSLF